MSLFATHCFVCVLLSQNENSRKPTKMGVGGAARNAQQTKVTVPQRGVAAGIKSKNKHLQEFENMKAKYRKRKGTFCFLRLLCGMVSLVQRARLSSSLLNNFSFLSLCLSLSQKPTSARHTPRTPLELGSGLSPRPRRPTTTKTTPSTASQTPKSAAPSRAALTACPCEGPAPARQQRTPGMR